MKYPPGEYIILKYAYWTKESANKIIILGYNDNGFFYRYDTDHDNQNRYREEVYFDDPLILVPVSPLMEELL